MPEELSYVLITPGAVRKARTGGILSRLISRTGLELVRARMFAPSEKLVQEYAATFSSETQEELNDYLFNQLATSTVLHPGAQPHALLLVFKGENAVEKIREVAGPLKPCYGSQGSVRDTFGDYVTDANGKLIYFEPAVLVGEDADSTARQLQLWAAYSDSDGGLLDHPAPEGVEGPYEKTLVLIKPDNFTFPNRRPGGVIDVFSRTGLPLVGVRVHHMSVAEALEFYGPVLEMLREKLGPAEGEAKKEALIEFMAGTRPSLSPADQREKPGSRKCVALIFQGINAVSKIRDVLGPTDPSKAPYGTIRKEYGESIMINGAHASDSADNARHEMGIIKIAENNLKPFVEAFYSAHPNG